jgi:hypothetical protein
MAIERATFPLPDTDDPLTAEFFVGAAHGELRIPGCDGCGRLVWYPQPTCPTCDAALQWRSVAPTGRIFSWAVVARPFLPAFADQVPFVTALVALDVDPTVRLCTYLVDIEPDSVRADLAVVAEFRPLVFPTVPGASVVVPMFRPIVP